MNETTTQPSTPEAARPEPVPVRERLRDKLFGLRSVLAVGVAGVVLGGAVGTAVTLVVDDAHGPRPGPGSHGAPMGVPGDRGLPGGPPAPPGGVPPAPAPSEQ